MLIQPKIMQTEALLEALAHIRSEWEQAADGQSLVEVQGSVGLLLADVVAAIGLASDEQAHVLGPGLARDLQGVLAQPFHQGDQ